MKLNEITRRWLKNFAGEKIFQRGEDYFQSGMVYQMEYHPDNFSIYAEVSGNYIMKLKFLKIRKILMLIVIVLMMDTHVNILLQSF